MKKLVLKPKTDMGYKQFTEIDHTRGRKGTAFWKFIRRLRNKQINPVPLILTQKGVTP